MASQQGFEYEKNVADSLKKRGWVKQNYSPAGASSDRPDLNFLFEGKEYGCELKLGLASAGSLVIHHLGFGKYEYGDTEGSEEKIFLKGIAQDVGMLRVIEEKWRPENRDRSGKLRYLNYPSLQRDKTKTWAEQQEHARQVYRWTLRKRYLRDKNLCPDIYFKVPSSTISKYYNLKKTYYLNVATHGFYLLGIKDPARINKDKYGIEKVPLWDDSHDCYLRVRVQSKGISKAEAAEKRIGYVKIGAGQGYQFTMELQFKNLRKSSYNIGPTIGRSAQIDEAKIILPEREEKILVNQQKQDTEEAAS